MAYSLYSHAILGGKDFGSTILSIWFLKKKKYKLFLMVEALTHCKEPGK